MPRRDLRNRQRKKQEHEDVIVMCLRDGPRTVPEIKEHFMAFGRHFGFFAAQLHAHETAHLADLVQDLAQDLRELGLADQPQASQMIQQSVSELFERGWLVGEERLNVTDAGREHLRRQMREGEHGWGRSAW